MTCLMTTFRNKRRDLFRRVKHVLRSVVQCRSMAFNGVFFVKLCLVRKNEDAAASVFLSLRGERQRYRWISGTLQDTGCCGSTAAAA
jgi:hypothetical protein